MKANNVEESLGESDRFIRCLRFAVFFLAVFTICLDSLLYDAVPLFVIIADFSASNCMLLLFPELNRNVRGTFWICMMLLTIYLLYYAAVFIFSGVKGYLLSWKPYLQLDFSIIALFLWLLIRRLDYSVEKNRASNGHIGNLISERYYRFFCMSVMISVMAITFSIVNVGGILGIILLSFIAVFIIILNILFSLCDIGSYDVLATENEIPILKKVFDNHCASSRISVSSDEKMRILYERVTEYMDSNKPFLNDDFEIPDLASSVFSNKTYLSRTINAFSGQNFRQFVNGYRIRYAVRILKDDPHLRMSEVADLCGFHNIVTFNMAFKLNMQETPTEWCQGYRASIRIGGVKHRYSHETGMSEA